MLANWIVGGSSDVTAVSAHDRSTMRILLLFVVVGVLALAVDAKKKRKFEGDFEFAEEVSSAQIVH